MVKIAGANQDVERKIRIALNFYPSWYIAAARIKKVELTSNPEVKAQIAMYEHGSRILYMSREVGDLILKAVGHELAHACDDIFGDKHYFSSMANWSMIHRNQGFFDIQKYRDEPLEYFADMMVKYFLLGEERLFTTNPNEVNFIRNVVFPALQMAVMNNRFDEEST